MIRHQFAELRRHNQVLLRADIARGIGQVSELVGGEAGLVGWGRLAVQQQLATAAL